jgi:molybdenum cofactor synthesis domain-containing protein
LRPGSFAENLITRGFNLEGLRLGQRLDLGEGVVLQITQRGKECHDRCAIYHQAGDCIMPRHGLFARVRRGGQIRPPCTIATNPALDSWRYGILTLSDRGAEGTRSDQSGTLLRELLESALRGATCVAQRMLPDERPAIEAELRRLCDEDICDLVLTTGGTGLSPRDVTPEATLSVVDRLIPGMAEAIRAAGLVHTPRAMLSRGICGLRGSSLLINLSGSPKAVREQLTAVLAVLPHAIETASGLPQDCGSP